MILLDFKFVSVSPVHLPASFTLPLKANVDSLFIDAGVTKITLSFEIITADINLAIAPNPITRVLNSTKTTIDFDVTFQQKATGDNGNFSLRTTASLDGLYKHQTIDVTR